MLQVEAHQALPMPIAPPVAPTPASGRRSIRAGHRGLGRRRRQTSTGTASASLSSAQTPHEGSALFSSSGAVKRSRPHLSGPESEHMRSGLDRGAVERSRLGVTREDEATRRVLVVRVGALVALFREGDDGFQGRVPFPAGPGSARIVSSDVSGDIRG